jgi:hypothetical protein
LSTVLNSDVAIKVNIQISRMFSRFRKIALAHSEIFLKLERVEKLGLKHDKHIELIFEYLKQFEKNREEEIDFENRPRIGFKPSISITFHTLCACISRMYLNRRILRV